MANANLRALQELGRVLFAAHTAIMDITEIKVKNIEKNQANLVHALVSPTSDSRNVQGVSIDNNEPFDSIRKYVAENKVVETAAALKGYVGTIHGALSMLTVLYHHDPTLEGQVEEYLSQKK